MTDKNITINCDMGESFGHWEMGNDPQVMPFIDCCNIACGFHAGDPVTMLKTLLLAKENSVEVGAHPGYPDKEGFGRRALAMSENELMASLLYQVSALVGLAKSVNTRVTYVKPHGALYNAMMKDMALFEVIVHSVAKLEGQLALMIQATTDFQRYELAAEKEGVNLRFEAFADRAYCDDGRLKPRNEPGAVLSLEKSLQQTRLLLHSQKINTESGKVLEFPVDSVCIHGDNPHVLKFLHQIKGNGN